MAVIVNGGQASTEGVKRNRTYGDDDWEGIKRTGLDCTGKGIGATWDHRVGRCYERMRRCGDDCATFFSVILQCFMLFWSPLYLCLSKPMGK